MTDCKHTAHRANSPYVVPVAGSELYVAYHGANYLDADANVVRHPVRMTFTQASIATQVHTQTCN